MQRRASNTQVGKHTSHLHLDLTLDEKEIFAGLDFGEHFDDDLHSYQWEICDELGEIFSQGSEEATKDEWKAEKFKLKAQLTTKRATNIFKTENLYTSLGWYTSLRLAYLRANRIANEYKHAIIPEPLRDGQLGFAKGQSLFAVFGFSYGIELLVDLGIIIKSLWKPGKNESQSRWTRFKNIMSKDDRPYRMANAALWLSINVAAFILTGGASAILNMAGFSADVVLDTFRGLREYYRHKKLLNKVNRKIKDVDDEIARYEHLKVARMNAIETQIQNIESIRQDLAAKAMSLAIVDPDLNEKYQALCNERTKHNQGLNDQEYSHLLKLQNDRRNLITIKTELKGKMKSVYENRRYAVFIACVVLVGMALVFFPPSHAAFMVGAWLALGGGSLIAGLGRRLWNRPTTVKIRNNVSDFFSAIKEKIKEAWLGDQYRPALKRTKSSYSLSSQKVDELVRIKSRNAEMMKKLRQESKASPDQIPSSLGLTSQAPVAESKQAATADADNLVASPPVVPELQMRSPGAFGLSIFEYRDKDNDQPNNQRIVRFAGPGVPSFSSSQ